MVRCQARTQKRMQCSRDANVGSTFCYQHQTYQGPLHSPIQPPGTARLVGTTQPIITPMITNFPTRVIPTTQQTITLVKPVIPQPTPVVTTTPATPTTPKRGISEEDRELVEQFINLIISEQDADIPREKEYLGYVRYLLNDMSKYDVYALLYPERTCYQVYLRVNVNKVPATVSISPSEEAFLLCLTRVLETNAPALAISTSFDRHANMIWVDPVSKEINRYDPQVPGDNTKQRRLDEALRKLFQRVLPDFTYLGNTLPEEFCVQAVRGQGRQHKSDYFCQDYSLLYADRRAQGMTHEEAAIDMVLKHEQMPQENAELLRKLAYRVIEKTQENPRLPNF